MPQKNSRITYKNVEVDNRTVEYAEKRLAKIEKVTPKFLNKEIEIGMDKKGHFRVEVMIKTPTQLFRAEDTTESIEGSIDSVAEDLYNQITREKNKLKDLEIRGARSLKKKTVLDENARFRK